MTVAVDWEELLTVESAKAVKLFVSQAEDTSPKLTIRGYTIPFTGTQ